MEIELAYIDKDKEVLNTIFNEVYGIEHESCRYNYYDVFPGVSYNDGLYNLYRETYDDLLSLNKSKLDKLDRYVSDEDFAYLLFNFGAEDYLELFNQYSNQGRVNKMKQMIDFAKKYYGYDLY